MDDEKFDITHKFEENTQGTEERRRERKKKRKRERISLLRRSDQ